MVMEGASESHMYFPIDPNPRWYAIEMLLKVRSEMEFYSKRELFKPCDPALNCRFCEMNSIPGMGSFCNPSFMWHMDYDMYLLTEHWVKIRRDALKRAGWRCQICNTDKGLNVHHRTYEHLWNEEISDLTVLCFACHSRHHHALAAHR